MTGGARTTAAAGAVLAWTSHQDVVDLGEKGQLGFDHSLGAYADVIGFLVLAGAGITAARSTREAADTRGFATQVLEWRPGLPFAVAGIIFGILAYTVATWIGPLFPNANFSDSGDVLSGAGDTG